MNKFLFTILFLSAAIYSATAQLSFVQPNIGTQWTAGQSYDIKIDNPGSYILLDGSIYLSTDGGITWNNILYVTELYNGTNTLNFQINQLTVASANCKLAISNWQIDTTWQYYTESAVFEILAAPASINVNQPLTNAFWKSGTQQIIGWNSVNVSQAEIIQYSVTGSAPWINIDTVTNPLNGSNTYSWSVSGVTGLHINSKVRVITIDETVSGISNVFTLSETPQLVFSYPAQGTQWVAGQSYNIVINNQSTAMNLNAGIYFSSDSGSTWNILTAVNQLDTGLNLFSWAIDTLTAASTHCRLAISSVSGYDTIYQYYSESKPFEILAAPEHIIVNQPLTDAFWQSGTHQIIAWKSVNVNQHEIIQYSITGGASWISIDTITNPLNGQNTYTWTVAGVTGINNNSKVRVESVDGSVSGISSVFTLSETPHLAFIHPATGTQWTAGETHQILLINQGIVQQNANAGIYLSTNNGATWTYLMPVWQLSTGPNLFNWTINPLTTASASCKLAISTQWHFDPNYQDYTESGIFEILTAPASISEIKPTADAYWQSGTQKSIVWNSVNVYQKEKIQYSIDGGTSWTNIDSITNPQNGQNTYLWTVAHVNGLENDAMIRVQSIDGTVSGNSPLFTISNQPQFAFIEPTTGLQWQKGQHYIITLQNNGPEITSTNSYFSIGLSSDGGATWNNVLPPYTVLNSGINVFTWLIGDTTPPSSNYQLVFVNNPSSTVLAFSQTFEIIQAELSLNINQPNAASYLVSNSQNNISWYSDSVSSVKIEYSLDNGVTWNTIVSAYPSVDGSNIYSWIVPVVAGTENDALLKISDNQSSVFTVSQAFTITSLPYQLTILTPNGGEVWTAGQPYSIKYNNSGPNSNNTAIFISTDGGNTWSNIGTDYTVSHGLNSFSWVIPNNFVPSANCLIKVQNLNIGVDVSDNVFEISNQQVSLSLTEPQNFEYWTTGTQHNIIWQTLNVPSVDIAYSLDGGLNWQPVASNVAAANGQNNYNWTLPVVSHNYYNCKIKIESPTLSIMAVSNIFTIASENQFVVLSPDTGDVWITGQPYDIIFKNNIGDTWVYLSYSVDGGNNWDYINSISSTSGNNILNWTIPAGITSQNCLVGVNWNGSWFISGTFEIEDLTPVLTIVNPPAVCSPNTVNITSNSVIVGNTNGGVLSYWTDSLATIPLNLPGAVSVSGTYYIKSMNANGVDIESVNVSINTVLHAGVSIAANPAGAICAGTNVIFTATPLNGGITPAYQWKLNGNTVGANSSTFTSTILTNNDTVTCIMTSDAMCVTGSPAHSDTIFMKVNPILPVSVSIAANPADAICAGTNVVFTALPVNGGTSPSYQWKVNGNIVGSDSPTFTSNTLANTDVVKCIMTSNATPCATDNPATSNSITMAVNPILTAGVIITANPIGAICSGTNVTFTATPINGGTTPIYQWKVNGIITGTNSNTFTSNTLANNDIVICMMTSNAAPCLAGSPATSAEYSMMVNPNLLVGLNIAVNPTGAVCAGTNVTFTATPVNGGTTPLYQWKVNGTTVGANSPLYTSNTLSDNDTVTCTMTSNALCMTGSPTHSDTIFMAFNPVLPAGVNIAANITGAVCEGMSVTFTATPQNGGPFPVYQWEINGNIVGSNSNIFSSNNLANNDSITCIMTSDEICVTGSPAHSDTIFMMVNPFLPANVSVAANPAGTVCAGTDVVFTATIDNGGPSPTYQWKVNGNIVGSNSDTFTSNILSNNDTVICMLTSDAMCIAGPPEVWDTIVMSVNPSFPASISITADPTGPLCAGTSVVFTATPVNGGTTPIYKWRVNGIVTGTNSATFTSNTLTNNDIVTCVLISTAPYCVTGSPATSNAIVMEIHPILTAGVNIAANPAGAICAGTNVVFTATPINGGTTPLYQWMVNWNITGSNSATFTTNTLTNHDTIMCIMASDAMCVIGSPAYSNTIIMTVNPLPDAAGNITGTDTVCQGQNGIAYSVLPIANSTSYIWAYSGTGASIIGNTNSVTISFSANATPGNLTVKGHYICGDGIVSADYPVHINLLPSVAGNITSLNNDSVTTNENNALYTVPIIADATSYIWTYTGTGATFVGGDTTLTNSATINYGATATSGNLTAKGHNSCGDGIASAIYQIYVSPVGIEEIPNSFNFQIYPNPTSGIITISINGINNNPDLQITDIQGKVIFTRKLTCDNQSYTKKIDLSAFPKGVYFVKLISESSLEIKKVVIL